VKASVSNAKFVSGPHWLQTAPLWLPRFECNLRDCLRNETPLLKEFLLAKATVDDKHVLFGVRVIVERQPLDNIWKPHRWVISDLIPLSVEAGTGAPPINDIPLVPLRTGDDGLSMLFTADASLDLHRAEAEAYAENLASSDPSIYLVLRNNENSDDHEVADEANGADIHITEISLSPYNIQDYEDCGEDQVEKLQLQGPIAEFVEAFVARHYHPEPFKKRKRDKVRIDKHEAGRGDARLERRNDVFNAPRRRDYQ